MVGWHEGQDGLGWIRSFKTKAKAGKKRLCGWFPPLLLETTYIYHSNNKTNKHTHTHKASTHKIDTKSLPNFVVFPISWSPWYFLFLKLTASNCFGKGERKFGIGEEDCLEENVKAGMVFAWGKHCVRSRGTPPLSFSSEYKAYPISSSTKKVLFSCMLARFCHVL